MNTFHAHLQLPYSCQQLFDLVKNIEQYPDFLPWCVGSKILSQESPTVLYARLNIGYQLLQSSYVSKVTAHPYKSIHVEQQEGPFKILTNRWLFEPLEENKSLIRFHLLFELKSSMFNQLLQAVFEKASATMIDAFENRAKTIYK